MAQDPNKLLNEAYLKAAKVRKDYEHPDSNGVDQDDAAELARLVIALKQYMSENFCVFYHP